MAEDLFPLHRQATDFLQPYDVAHRRRAEGLLGRVQQARGRGVHGAGGLVGSALQGQYAAEGEFAAAMESARQMRDAEERQRLMREAQLRAQMKNQMIANYAGAAGNIGSALGAGIIGLTRRPNQASGGSSPIGSVGSGNFYLTGQGQRRFDLGGR